MCGSPFGWRCVDGPGQVGAGITVEYPHVEHPHLTAEGGNVRVKFRMVIPARNIQQNKTIEMVPVLANRDGESLMTPIMVTGRRKDLSDLRKRVLSGTEYGRHDARRQGSGGRAGL